MAVARPRKSRSRSSAQHLAVIERRQNLKIERRERNKVEEQALEDRFDQTVELAEGRGEVIERPARKRGEERKPMRRMTGLMWLLSKKRISEEEFVAGERYGEICATAATGDFVSVMAERASSGFGSKSPAEVKLDAVFAKVSADQAIRGALPADMGQRIVLLLERVCAAGATVREIANQDRPAAEAMETELKFGLNLMMAYFAKSSPKRSEKRQLTNGAKSHDQSANERFCA